MRENGVATLGWKCTLSLGGPLIIYPYWTQFTLKLTGSRLVSLAKLTSKLTIYDRSSVGSLAHSLTYSLVHSFVHSLARLLSRLVLCVLTLFWPSSVRQRDAPNPSKCHRIRDRCRREGDIWRSLNFHKFIAHLQPTFRIVLKIRRCSHLAYLPRCDLFLRNVSHRDVRSWNISLECKSRSCPVHARTVVYFNSFITAIVVKKKRKKTTSATTLARRFPSVTSYRRDVSTGRRRL